MRFFLITCTLLFLGVVTGYSQNRKTVEYDFDTRELKAAIPFDQPFNIKCVNIPASVKDVQITIFDVNRMNYKGKWTKDQPLTDEQLKANKDACTLFYQTEKHPRNSSDTLNIPVLVFLRPNASYHIKISGTEYTPLTEEENQKAVEGIMNDEGFAAAINQVIVKQVLSPTASKRWSENHAGIHNAAEAAVKKVNEKYTVSGDNYEDQFTRFLTATNALNQIRAELRHHKEGLYAEANAILSMEGDRKPKELADKEAEIDAINQQIKTLEAGLKDTAKNKNGPQLLRQMTDEKRKLDEPAKELAEIKERIESGKEAISDQTYPQDLPVGQISAAVAKQMKGIDWFNATKADLDFESAFKSDLKKEKIAGLKDTEISAIADQMAEDFQAKIDDELDELLAARDEFKENIAIELSESVYSHNELGNTYPTDLEERFKMHVTLDLGYAYVGRVDRFNLYAGMNIYMRAIDTALPLSNYRGKFLDVVGSRTSLLVGVSLQSIKKEGIRRGIVSDDMALITGVGFRLLSFFKINGGAYFFYQYPTDPLANKNNYHVKAAPFVSLSLDFNVRSFLQSFGNGHVASIFTE